MLTVGLETSAPIPIRVGCYEGLVIRLSHYLIFSFFEADVSAGSTYARRDHCFLS